MSTRTLVVAGLLLAGAGCTLDSNPDADSVGRARPTASSSAPVLRPAEAGEPTVEVTAPVDPKFDKTTYEADAGVLNISFSTTGNHNLNLVGPGLVDPLVWGEAAGAKEDRLTYAVTLVKGTYIFYCSVQGHRAAGMQGTIQVT